MKYIETSKLEQEQARVEIDKIKSLLALLSIRIAEYESRSHCHYVDVEILGCVEKRLRDALLFIVKANQ